MTMDKVAAVYNQDPQREWQRLIKDPYHSLEFLVTMHYLHKHLPASGKVLDAGGGPGRYALELCRAGYEVVLLDISSALIDLAREQIKAEPQAVQDRLQEFHIGDIRDLSRFETDTFDAVLCLGGPLTHISEPPGCDKAVTELVRVARPGAAVCISVVGYLAVLRTVLALFSDDLLKPSFQPLVERGDDFGPTATIWHFFRAAELRQLAEAHGLETIEMAGCQGLSTGLVEATNLLARDEAKWQVWTDLVVKTSAEPAVVDMAEHILYIGKVGARHPQNFGPQQTKQARNEIAQIETGSVGCLALTMDPASLIRPDIATMETYTPVFPFEVLAARLGRAPEEIVKLDANENPYGAPPAVREALANMRYAHIYPDPESRALREALARFTGLPTDLLLAGAGADELIDLVMRLFLSPGDAIINCPPTFGMYPFDADVAAAKTISIPRRADFSLDIQAIEEAVDKHCPKIIFVASPNNPDGSLLPDADFARLLALPPVLVLDEAYVEFAGLGCSRIGQVPQRDNLIVLRTFSKWAGLAGLRVGYGAFPAALMPHLWKIKQPYNVSVAASEAAIAVLNEPGYLEMHIARMIAERERLSRLLAEIPYLRVYPSRSTFVLCQVVGRDAHDLKATLEREGILVRYYSTLRLRDHVRISVGRPEQVDTLITVLRRL